MDSTAGKNSLDKFIKSLLLSILLTLNRRLGLPLWRLFTAIVNYFSG